MEIELHNATTGTDSYQAPYVDAGLTVGGKLSLTILDDATGTRITVTLSPANIKQIYKQAQPLLNFCAKTA